MSAHSDLTVLVVDDDANCREVLARLLSKVANCRVIEASDGAEGLNVVAAERPDLILLDLMMPEVGGKEMLAQIRVDPYFSDIPVIICSAVDELDHVRGIIELGISDYVLKPYSLDTLLAKLKATLEKASAQARSRRAGGEDPGSLRSGPPPAVRKLLLVTDNAKIFKHVQASVAPAFCCFHAKDRVTAIRIASAEHPEAIFIVSPLSGGSELNLARMLRALPGTQTTKLFRMFSDLAGAVDADSLEGFDGSFMLTHDRERLSEWIHQCLGPGPFRITREPGTLVVQLYDQDFNRCRSQLLEAVGHHLRSTGDRRIVFDITAWRESGTSVGTGLGTLIARLRALGFDVSVLGGPNLEGGVTD